MILQIVVQSCGQKTDNGVDLKIRSMLSGLVEYLSTFLRAGRITRIDDSDWRLISGDLETFPVEQIWLVSVDALATIGSEGLDLRRRQSPVIVNDHDDIFM